jgi:hypothetical protein
MRARVRRKMGLERDQRQRAGRQGRRPDRRQTQQGQTVSPNIGIDAFGNANRIVHTWSVTYGGFNFSTDVTMISDGTTVKLGSSLQDTNVGIEEFYVIPLEVTYQWGDVHFLAGTGVAIPVSSYDPTRLANASLNYYGINQTVAVTWFPSPKWELSAQAEFTFNFRNPATQSRATSSMWISA